MIASRAMTSWLYTSWAIAPKRARQARSAPKPTRTIATRDFGSFAEVAGAAARAASVGMGRDRPPWIDWAERTPWRPLGAAHARHRALQRGDCPASARRAMGRLVSSSRSGG